MLLKKSLIFSTIYRALQYRIFTSNLFKITAQLKVADIRDINVIGIKTMSQVDEANLPSDSRSRVHELSGIKFEGVSLAGQETCIILPQYKLVFDIGRCPQRATSFPYVLLSHGHLDHMGGVPFHVHTRHMNGVTPSVLVVHPSYPEKLKSFLSLASSLQFGEEGPCEIKCLCRSNNSPPYTEQDSSSCSTALWLSKDVLVKAFQTFHPVPSQGYVIYSIRRKLRIEYQGLSGSEIRDLRLSGVDVMNEIHVPEVAFTGDTSSDLFTKTTADPDVLYDVNDDSESRKTYDPVLEDAFRAKVLFIECSFVDDSVSEEEAYKKGHMHLRQILANVHRIKCQHIVLIHFSTRYTSNEIEAALAKDVTDEGLRNRFFPFLNGFKRSTNKLDK